MLTISVFGDYFDGKWTSYPYLVEKEIHLSWKQVICAEGWYSVQPPSPLSFLSYENLTCGPSRGLERRPTVVVYFIVTCILEKIFTITRFIQNIMH